MVDFSSQIVIILICVSLGLPGGWLAARIVGGYRAPRPRLIVAVPAAAAVFAWAALIAPPPGILAASLGLGWTLLCLTSIDAACFRLPDRLTLPLLAVGLLVALGLPGRPLLDHLTGAAMGFALLAAIGFAFRRWRGQDAIGLGDAKLLAAAGAWLGWRPLPSVVLLACIAALTWAAVVALRKGGLDRRQPIAFGTALAGATWIVWLYGTPIG